MSQTLPMTPEEITPAWLTQALGARFSGARVSKVEILERHAGTTGRAQLRVAYASGSRAPEEVFAKLPPPDPMQRAMVQATGMGRKEARFYAELAEEVPVRVARPYFGGWTEDGASYIVLMEDLAASGCSFPDPVAGADPGYARDVIDSLARLHAHLWNSERFEGDLRWLEPPSRHEIGPRLVQAAVERFASEMPPVFGEVGRLYVEHTEALNDLWEEGEQTLVHGDSHIGNLFEDRGRPGFLDWGVLCRAPGLRDVSYFLSNSLAPELRRAGERDLIRRYLAELEGAGVDAPGFDQAWRRHRRYAAYTWVAATTTLVMGDQWQSLPYGREAVRRTNAAVADLRTVELLREELGLPSPG